MAVTVTARGTTWTTTAGDKTVVATPAVGDLIVVIAAATGVATTAITDTQGGTYTKVDVDRTGFSTTGTLNAWIRTATIPAASSTTFTATQTSSTGGGLTVLSVSSMGFTGASALRSSGGQSTVASGTPAPVLSQTPLSTNPIIAAVATSSNSTTNVIQRTGYTEDTDSGYNTPPTGLEVSHLVSGETTATITFGGAAASQFASIALELAGPVNAAIAQVAGTITAAGGTQSVVSVSSSAITQLAGAVTSTGGTQAIRGNLTSLSNDLISYYKLDDASGTAAADAAGTNTGTWQGTLGSQWGTGKINGDGVFNGSDNRISLPQVITSDTFTIAAWIFPTADGTLGSSGGGIFYQGTGATDLGTELGVGALNANSLFFRYEGGTLFQASANIITLNAWNFVAITYNAGAAQFYVGSTALDSTTGLGTATPSTNGASIGSWYNYGDPNRYFHGSIDEVGVWNRPLSGAEITTLYNSGTGLQFPFTSGSVVNASITQVAATVTAGGGTQSISTSNFVAISQSAATTTATGGTQTATTNSSNAQVAANVTNTGGTQTVATVNIVSISQVAGAITAGGGTQTLATVNNVSITQVAASVTATGGTQSIATVNSVAISQAAGTVTATGGIQAIATTSFAAVGQSAATVTTTGGTQALSGASTVAQVVANVVAAGGTQTVASVQNQTVTQVAGAVTTAGGTQAVATVNNVNISQVAGVVTSTGGTQSVATVNKVSVTQVAASVTATGGTQSLASMIDAAIAQQAANVTATGGLQDIFAGSGATSVDIAQLAASLTATGGVPVISTATGPLPTATAKSLIFLTDGHVAVRLGGNIYQPL